MIAALDEFALRMAGRQARVSEVLDQFIVVVLDPPTYKMLPIVSCLLFVWFSRTEAHKSQLAVIHGAVGTVVAVVISRLIQNFAPERPRPLYSGHPDFVAPIGVGHGALKDWSSFPSDNAALAFAISTAIWRASKPLGVLCYVWSALVVSFPRLYAGYHYASDLIEGALIGTASVLILARLWSGSASFLLQVKAYEESHRPLYYTCFFVISYQVMSMFGDLRRPLRALLDLLL